MRAHGNLRRAGVACFDRSEDRRVLVDEPLDRRRMRKAQIAHAVHLRLHLLYDTPRILAVDAEGEATVERFVERQKAGRLRFHRGGALCVENALQVCDRVCRHYLACPARDGDLDSFAYEARIGHLLGGNLDNEGAALRTYADEPRFAQLDECLAHRLPAHAEAHRDLVFRERLARRQCHGHDGLLELAENAKRGGLAGDTRITHPAVGAASIARPRWNVSLGHSSGPRASRG